MVFIRLKQVPDNCLFQKGEEEGAAVLGMSIGGKGFEAVLEKTTVALVIFNLSFLDGVHLQTIGEDSLCH